MEPRSSGEPPKRYSDRFRGSEAFRDDYAVLGESDRSEPTTAWPRWVVRTTGVVGVAAAALVAVTLGDRPAPVPDSGPTTSIPAPQPTLNPSPPTAQIDVIAVSARPWESRGFTYRLTLANATDEAYQVIGVGPAMSGTEVAWDRAVVVAPGSEAELRIDYLVVNCMAATTSAIPDVVRLVVRHGGAAGPVELARFPIAEQAAVIEAAGDRICGDTRGGIDPLG